MRVHPDVLCKIASGKHRGSAAVLLRAARVAGISVEHVLSETLRTVNASCPHCGRCST